MDRNNRKKDIMVTVAAYFLPAFIMLFICIALDIYPFGKVSILVADMRYQFVDYIGYMKSIFFGNNDFLYSFSKTFGGDMSGFAAYYLFNPFYLMLLLFPNSELPAGIMWMVVVMCGFCGLAFNRLLKEVYGNRIASLIFSTAYALMGYYVAYVNCIHYFFSIIMFPLVILGLYKTYRSKKINLFFIFSITLCVCSNYYIGYMVLIFTAAFFVCMYINDLESIKDLKNKSKRRVIWVVLVSAFLGIGISAFSLFSVVFSLRGQKSSGLLLSFSRTFRLTEFFSGLYSNAFHGNISDGLPIIYSGVIPVIFVFLYYLNKNIAVKEKILSACMFLFMIVGFWLDAFNVAWHGFAHPIGFPYRNSFLFSFLVIFFGYKGFLNLKEGFKGYYANIVVVVFAVYSLFLLLTHSVYVTMEQVAVTGMILAISLICIFMLQSGRKYVIPAIVGIIIMQCGDLAFNGYMSIDAYYTNRYEDSYSYDEYSDYVTDLQNAVADIENQDDSFYRIDKLYRRTHNDAMLIGYNGLSHFSSCETDTAKRFMGKMGYRDNGNWAYYAQGSTTFADSFMGLKYLLSQYDQTTKPYERIGMYGENYAYKNPYALPICFGMNKDAYRIKLGEKDPFVLQNNIASCYSDTNYRIYRKASVKEVRFENVEKDGVVYKKINDGEAYIEYSLISESTDMMYMYFDAPSIQETRLDIDEMGKAPMFSMYDWCIREVGKYDPGYEIKVRIYLEQDEIEIDNAYFYYESGNVLKKWHEDAIRTSCDVNKITSSHLIAKVNVSNDADLIVFTMPYEKDWLVYVDGNKVNAKPVMNSLLSIDNIEAGEHIIELRYIPRGLVIGSVVSVICLITTFCIFFLSKRTKSTRQKNI